MVFEIKSFEIVSIERHPTLRYQVCANVLVGLTESLGSHVLDLNLRVIVDEDEDDAAVQLAVLGTAARVIRRIIAAIDQHEVADAAE
jgi:hypothetical protein